jgi:ABC-type multidrug transport system fused ATPase/permease subunit
LTPSPLLQQDVENGHEQGSTTPTLSWDKLTYSVNDGKKSILNNCTGQVHAGQVCAILGPSGLDVVTTQ